MSTQNFVFVEYTHDINDLNYFFKEGISIADTI